MKSELPPALATLQGFNQMDEFLFQTRKISLPIPVKG